MTKQRITALFAIMLASLSTVFFIPKCAHASPKPKGGYDTSLVHDAQLLLSLSGLDTGHPDGRCGPQTKQAIAAYIDTLSQKPTGPVCSPPFLRELIDNLRLSLGHSIRQINNNPTTNLLSSKFDSITKDINDEMSDIYRLQ